LFFWSEIFDFFSNFLLSFLFKFQAIKIFIRALLNRIDIYPIDDETAEIYGDFKSEIIKRFAAKEKSKRKTTQLQEIGIGENDLWIAATALRHSLILVTSDSDFQRMRQVREFPVESWI